MKNWQINQMLEAFDESRRNWVDILVKNPGHSEAAQMIIVINAKMEVYRSMWSWYDESIEMANVR